MNPAIGVCSGLLPSQKCDNRLGQMTCDAEHLVAYARGRRLADEYDHVGGRISVQRLQRLQANAVYFSMVGRCRLMSW
jgi:hypothetical protein